MGGPNDNVQKLTDELMQKYSEKTKSTLHHIVQNVTYSRDPGKKDLQRANDIVEEFINEGKPTLDRVKAVNSFIDNFNRSSTTLIFNYKLVIDDDKNVFMKGNDGNFVRLVNTDVDKIDAATKFLNKNAKSIENDKAVEAVAGLVLNGVNDATKKAINQIDKDNPRIEVSVMESLGKVLISDNKNPYYKKTMDSFDSIDYNSKDNPNLYDRYKETSETRVVIIPNYTAKAEQKQKQLQGQEDPTIKGRH